MSPHVLLLSFFCCTCVLLGQPDAGDVAWTFTVSGDSRNCGDVVMPSIALGTHQANAAFYWHLGDLRAVYDFDQDFKALHPDTTVIKYTTGAWEDFIQNQAEAFEPTPFFLGIGNHEAIPPKTRQEFILQFADWLNSPTIRSQRLLDDRHDHAVRTYYHWIKDGIDFINVDNATPDQFDSAQLAWIKNLLAKDVGSPEIRAVVMGMHEALPDSIAAAHSMSDAPTPQATGRQVYQELLALRKQKPVYVLASHSHFFMEGIFNTPYLKEHEEVLPGWIIGTAGAVRYKLPDDAKDATAAREHVYGYLLAKVSSRGKNDRDPIRFEFHEVGRGDVPAEVVQRFSSGLVDTCYTDNPKVQ